MPKFDYNESVSGTLGNDCLFCGAKNVGRNHHCPAGYYELPKLKKRKKRMGTTTFLILAIIVIGGALGIGIYRGWWG